MTHPSHKTRYSDSSLYDEVCEFCGHTDGRGFEDLNVPCTKEPADHKLTRLLKDAAKHVMTPRERWDQRVSFVYGQMMDCNPNITKEEVEQHMIEMHGAKPSAHPVHMHVSTQKYLASKHYIAAREMNVISGLARGLSNKEIARELNIAEATTKVHVKSVMAKMGVRNRTALALMVQKIDLFVHFGLEPQEACRV